MAMHWNAENVKDSENVCKVVLTEDDPSNGLKAGDEIWSPVTMSLVWAALSTGIGTITEANAAEVYARINFVEEFSGPFLRRGEGAPHNITPEEVQAHIGLSTNVYGTETRRKFLGRFDVDVERAKQRYLRATKKEEVKQ